MRIHNTEMHRPGAIAGSPQPTYAVYYPPTPGAYPMSYPTPGPSYGTPQQGVPAVRPRPQVMTAPFSPAFANGQGQMQGQGQGQGQQGMSMIGSPSPNKASFPRPFILPQQHQQQQQSQQQYGNGQSYPTNGTVNLAASYPQQQLQAQQLQQAQQQQAQQQFFQQQLMQQHQQQMQGMSDNNSANTGGGNEGPLPENMMQLLARSNPPSPSRDPLSPGVRIMTSPGMGGENIQ